jgi:hypothetical protein
MTRQLLVVNTSRIGWIVLLAYAAAVRPRQAGSPLGGKTPGYLLVSGTHALSGKSYACALSIGVAGIFECMLQDLSPKLTARTNSTTTGWRHRQTSA